jgi:hypothetical protein
MRQTREEFERGNVLTAERLGSLVALEQRVWRSYRHHECADCGGPGTVQQESVLIKSVPYYWLCQDCRDYWESHD